MTTTLQALQEVRQLLTDPAHWQKHSYAKDAKGHSVDTTSPEAVSFCLVGAISHCLYNQPSTQTRVCESLWKLLPNHQPSLVMFNDKATHEEVLQLLDKAIAAEQRN